MINQSMSYREGAQSDSLDMGSVVVLKVVLHFPGHLRGYKVEH